MTLLAAYTRVKSLHLSLPSPPMQENECTNVPQVSDHTDLFLGEPAGRLAISVNINKWLSPYLVLMNDRIDY